MATAGSHADREGERSQAGQCSEREARVSKVVNPLPRAPSLCRSKARMAPARRHPCEAQGGGCGGSGAHAYQGITCMQTTPALLSTRETDASKPL